MPQEKILVVDDEEDILELIRFNLSRDGYDISCANTGETALKALKTQPVDLIVLDLMLPEVNGWEVCRRLRAGTEGFIFPRKRLSHPRCGFRIFRSQPPEKI